MEENLALIVIGSIAILALGVAKFFNRYKAPFVIGYIICGVILGRSFLNILTPHILNKLEIVNDLALGIISFTIGAELHLVRLRRLGKAILSIAFCEATGAFVLVGIATYFLVKNVYFALILGSIASATAPAATVSVINQYRARGPLTTTILGVVGVDDAIALIIYTFVSVICYSFFVRQHLNLLLAFLHPAKDIVYSLLLGAGLGGILSYLLRRMRDKKEIFGFTIGFIFLGEGIALKLGISELLLVMTLGFMVSNLSPRKINTVTDSLNVVGFPLIAVFFTLAGAKLDIKLLPSLGLLGLIYLVARLLGKLGGAFLGAKLSKAPSTIRKYVGFSLWPQIGVAVALAIMVERDFASLGSMGAKIAQSAVNILLFTTIFTEILGPIATKISLEKAGEIRVR